MGDTETEGLFNEIDEVVYSGKAEEILERFYFANREEEAELLRESEKREIFYRNNRPDLAVVYTTQTGKNELAIAGVSLGRMGASGKAFEHEAQAAISDPNVPRSEWDRYGICSNG